MLQVPKPILSRLRAKYPIWWKSRPAPIQRVSASPDPWIHGPWVHTTALPQFQHWASLPTNQDKWKSKCYTPDCKYSTGREATNSTTDFQHTCLCKISLGHRSQGNKSNSAPWVISQRSSVSPALWSPCDSDGCHVASWVQMKYQIVSWGLYFPFLLVF